MGSVIIDLGLKNVWQSWRNYRKGKKWSPELHEFQYYLENNIYQLHFDIQSNRYVHGEYRKFIVADTKKREISVAGIRDRVVHRLLYDYLNEVYDKTFLYDAWSCRMGKGLKGAIERAQEFLESFPHAFFWKADVQKFFDHVDHEVLLSFLKYRVHDEKALHLLEEVIRSFSFEPGIGIPIGNLTSQIFANIYLNELDRFVKHELKPKAYLRYGDDFVLLDPSREKLIVMKEEVTAFLQEQLHLTLHQKEVFRKARQGLPYLGVVLYPKGRKLNARSRKRLKNRLTLRNAPSYFGLLAHHGSQMDKRLFRWRVMEKFQLYNVGIIYAFLIQSLTSFGRFSQAAAFPVISITKTLSL